jgi:hypothetical protein
LAYLFAGIQTPEAREYLWTLTASQKPRAARLAKELLANSTTAPPIRKLSASDGFFKR